MELPIVGSFRKKPFYDEVMACSSCLLSEFFSGLKTLDFGHWNVEMDNHGDLPCRMVNASDFHISSTYPEIQEIAHKNNAVNKARITISTRIS